MALSDEQTHMRLAIHEARRSRGEEGRVHPYVGAEWSVTARFSAALAVAT